MSEAASSYICRPARSDEVDVFLALWRDLGWEPEASYPAAIHRAVRGDGFRIISTRETASASSEPLGCLVACHHGEVGFVGYFSMLPECKGKGLGTLLLQDSIKYLQQLGCTSIGLDAVPTAAGLYERHGFISTGKRISWYTLDMDPKANGISADTIQAQHSIEEIQRGDEEAINRFIELDAALTGFRRSDLIKELIPSAKWHLWTMDQFDTVGKARKSYIATRPTPSGHSVGPIYAESYEHARSMLQHVVKYHTNAARGISDKVMFAVEACSFNPNTHRLFTGCGWTEDDYYYHVGLRSFGL